MLHGFMYPAHNIKSVKKPPQNTRSSDKKKETNKLRGLIPRANYTDRVTSAFWQS
jgi:hypothetical protein